MSKRETKVKINLAKPVVRSLGSGHRGRSPGVPNKKTKKRKIALTNLSSADRKLKKVKITQDHLNNTESRSQRDSINSERSLAIQTLLEEEVNVVPWEQKRILAVHAYYFF